MHNVRFCGDISGPSGYAEFSRYFIYALHKAGVNVSVEPINIDPQKLDYGVKGRLCRKLIKKSNNPRVNIIAMVPTLFKRYRKPGMLNIGFTMWESSRLPDLWVKLCNEMDAIFVPCSWNKKVFEESGVTVPVYLVQPGINPEEIPELREERAATDKYNFYSIFQWIERKNPLGLVKAYFSEFSKSDNVALTLKTYKNAKMYNNLQLITGEIEELKKDMNLGDDYPELKIIPSFISNEEMNNLHNLSDCFVLPHRGEGFGMPHMEAMIRGNPVIATNYSGNTDFMSESNSYPVNYTMTPAVGMGRYVPWYNGRMWWAEADLKDMADKMRYVYENRKEARDIGMQGRIDIKGNLNLAASAKQFISAMNETVDSRNK